MFKRKHKEVNEGKQESVTKQEPITCKTTCSTTCDFKVGNYSVSVTTGDTNNAVLKRAYNISYLTESILFESKEELLHLCKEIIHKLNTFPT